MKDSKYSRLGGRMKDWKYSRLGGKGCKIRNTQG